MTIDPGSLKAGTIAVAVLLIGTLGISLLEGWPLVDSFYMTIITMSTVGYGETHELSLTGRCFNVVMILTYIGTMTFLTASITSFIVGNDLEGTFRRRKMMKAISELSGHTIICGASPMAEAVIDRLMKRRCQVVLVDSDQDRLRDMRERWRKLLTVEGNATCELTLANANVLQAAHVVAALESEMDNLLIAITCKDIGPQVKVMAQSNNTTIANRMRKASVDEVVSAGQIVGNYVADAILN